MFIFSRCFWHLSVTKETSFCCLSVQASLSYCVSCLCVPGGLQGTCFSGFTIAVANIWPFIKGSGRRGRDKIGDELLWRGTLGGDWYQKVRKDTCDTFLSTWNTSSWEDRYSLPPSCLLFLFSVWHTKALPIISCSGERVGASIRIFVAARGKQIFVNAFSPKTTWVNYENSRHFMKILTGLKILAGLLPKKLAWKNLWHSIFAKRDLFSRIHNYLDNFRENSSTIFCDNRKDVSFRP